MNQVYVTRNAREALSPTHKTVHFHPHLDPMETQTSSQTIDRPAITGSRTKRWAGMENLYPTYIPMTGRGATLLGC